MIPVLIVPVLARPELLYRMLSSIDYPVEQLVIIDNGDVVEAEQVAQALRGVPGPVGGWWLSKLPGNLGVAGSWNLGIKATPFAPWWLVANFDIVWPAGALAQFAALEPRDRIALSAGRPPWCAFAIGEEVVQAVGLFDEALHPAYFEDDDMARRTLAAGLAVEQTAIDVWHDNSSTLAAGYAGRNQVSFPANAAYYEAKRGAGDLTEGRWSLERRRQLSWD